MNRDQAATSLDIGIQLDQEDKFTSKATAALAIMDCVRVLCSLERMPHLAEARMSTGRGYAWGEITRDASISDALYHAMGLVCEMQDMGEAAMQGCRKPATD